MLIAQDNFSCNNEESQINKVLISGNLVPTSWYHSLVRECGKSDTNAITILSELVFLHRCSGNTEFQLNFRYFSKKFNFGLSQVKDAIVRLEQKNLVRRSLQTIIISGRRFNNEMFLILNIDNVLKLTQIKLTQNSNNKSQVKKFPLDDRKSNNCSAEISADKIDKKYLFKKYRSNEGSNESNFVSNSFLEKQSSLASIVIQKQRFSFASFYPLVQSDINKLQSLCGREFSTNAINEILQSLSIKLPKHNFPHKKAFMKYMGKALTYEMRDATRISNEGFRINGNLAKEEVESKAREGFLSNIENSRDISCKMQLSRKLAGILEPSLAYSFLKSASFIDDRASLKADSFGISLSKNLELTSLQHGQILEQVQSVYGTHIRHLDIILPQEFAVKTYQDRSIKKSSSDTYSTSQQSKSLVQEETKSFEGIWGKVREGLIEYYGSTGKAMDHSWFSKLKANVDIDSKKLTLTAPTKFIKDWVESHYSYLIDKLCRFHNYSLDEVIAS